MNPFLYQSLCGLLDSLESGFGAYVPGVRQINLFDFGGGVCHAKHPNLPQPPHFWQTAELTIPHPSQAGHGFVYPMPLQIGHFSRPTITAS
jgi:hypothetical protein